MKGLLAALLLVLPLVAAAKDAPMDPLKAINHFGSITISDGSSFFTFYKGGKFGSGPLGDSGRTLAGHWKVNEDDMLVATAKAGWINGVSALDDYRRISFAIYDVTPRTSGKERTYDGPRQIFDCYFIIDELVKIPKPADAALK